ncbi:hypothetical protein HJG60_008298 [Phyllostomus discolor]|uniref:Uncharacterized protein n=1 Tax=Phyllostomus discolor TaxID=89673 RepID=A0A833Z1J9_9CHIR|nr:hypothetical protein HJG60_008298 [Phyllostomus discolor]
MASIHSPLRVFGFLLVPSSSPPSSLTPAPYDRVHTPVSDYSCHLCPAGLAGLPGQLAPRPRILWFKCCFLPCVATVENARSPRRRHSGSLHRLGMKEQSGAFWRRDTGRRLQLQVGKGQEVGTGTLQALTVWGGTPTKSGRRARSRQLRPCAGLALSQQCCWSVKYFSFPHSLVRVTGCYQDFY